MRKLWFIVHLVVVVVLAVPCTFLQQLALRSFGFSWLADKELLLRGWTNSCVLAEITGFSFLYQILSMQLALWNKTAISWWAEFMDDKVLACLSESHFKKFLLSEIVVFLVFDLCKTATGESVNGCRKAKVTHQKQRVQFKDQDFLGREFLYYWNHFLK